VYNALRAGTTSLAFSLESVIYAPACRLRFLSGAVTIGLSTSASIGGLTDVQVRISFPNASHFYQTHQRDVV
jgi:hypothetical protein